MRCRLPIAVVLLVSAAAAVGTAGARVAPPTAGPRLAAEPAQVRPGEMLVLRGHGFPRRADVTLLAGPPGSEAERIGGARTGRGGGFTATIRIRAQSSAGRYVVLACHDACVVKASAHFRIVAP